MSFQGGYSDSSSANLLLSIGGTAPGDEYGHISFSTPLAANGTLSVSTRNGFLPSPGESFKLLSYPAATNNFGCLVGLDLGGGILLQPEFRSGNLALLARAYTTNAHMPQLFISPALGGMAIIIWPVGLSDWSLQSATNLSWHACLPLPITCSNQALVPNNTLQQYFRLQQNN